MGRFDAKAISSLSYLLMIRRKCRSIRIANSCAANSKSVCSPGLGDHAMYEVDLDGEVVNRSQRDEVTESRIIHC